MDYYKFFLLFFVYGITRCTENPVSDDQCSAVFHIPGNASELGHSLCQLTENCTSCCVYNTTCCGFLGCCNGSCCDGQCCDINYGTCQKLASSDTHVCVPNGHNLCGDTICDLNYQCCGALCVPDGSDCCDSGTERYCGPSTFCCGSGCCDDSSPVCCSDYQSCCTSDVPTCCPTTCCPGDSYCCADKCCPNGSDHCGDGYYCAAGTHCCGSGSGSWCCGSSIDCCKSGCCTSTSPRCCDNLCWLNGWQPCRDSDVEIDGVPKILTSILLDCDKREKCQSAKSAFVSAITRNVDDNVKRAESRNVPFFLTAKSKRAFSYSQSSKKSGTNKSINPKVWNKKVSPNCLSNSATSTDPCFGFPCFMQITDCKSDTGYLNYFGEGMLCKKEAEASLFDDPGRVWWNCSQTCITSEIKSTMNNPIVPCCNSLQEYGLKFVNPKCFVAECGFCSIYVNNFVALEEIFAENVQNIYWQQILNFMDDCKRQTTSTTHVFISTSKPITTTTAKEIVTTPEVTTTNFETSTDTTTKEITTTNAITTAIEITTTPEITATNFETSAATSTATLAETSSQPTSSSVEPNTSTTGITTTVNVPTSAISTTDQTSTISEPSTQSSSESQTTTPIPTTFSTSNVDTTT